MFEKKECPQSFEKNKKEGHSIEELAKMIKMMVVETKKKNIEELKEMIEMEIEISGRDNEKENGVIEISEELRNTIVSYLYNKFEIKGLKEEKKLSLYFYGGDLYLNTLDPEGEVLFSWLIEDKEIIKDIEELIS